MLLFFYRALMPNLCSIDRIQKIRCLVKAEPLILAALIPGGGQMYLGETDRGLPLLVAFSVGLLFQPLGS